MGGFRSAKRRFTPPKAVDVGRRKSGPELPLRSDSAFLSQSRPPPRRRRRRPRRRDIPETIETVQCETAQVEFVVTAAPGAGGGQ